MEEKLPIYQLIIDDEDTDGINAISLVFNPAIEEDFVLFNKDKKIQFSVNEVEGIVTGPVLIPDQLIYRFDGVNEFYVKMDANTIKKLAMNFIKNHNQNDITLNHETSINGVYVFESWLTGENDKAKDLGYDVPRGTWMVSMKVDSPQILNEIKQGKIKGFSIEGYLKRIPVAMSSNGDKDIEEMTEKELEELYDEINNIIKNR